MKKLHYLLPFLLFTIFTESTNAQTITYGFSHDFTNGAVHSPGPFSVSNKDIAPTGFAFSADGSKMFVTGQSSHSVHQYALTTPFDITSGVAFETSFSVIANALSPEAIAFNPAGTLMYVLESNGVLNQYTLSNPFDITTGVAFDDDVFLSSNLDGFTLSADGSKLITAHPGVDKVLQYTLTTPFDVSGGVVFDVNLSINEEAEMQDLVFNPEGTKMFVVGFSAGGKVSQYNLTTPFDISSGVSFSGVSFSLLAEQPSATDIKFSADGKRLFSIGRTDDEVNQYDLNVGGFNETPANLGALEGSLTISLLGDTFINPNGTLTSPNDYQITNLPTGLTPAMNVAADGLSVVLTLTGSVTDHQQSHDISSLIFDFSDDAFDGGSAGDIANAINTPSGIGISFDDNPVISYSSSGAGFTESGANTGSINESLTVTLSGDTFTNAGSQLLEGSDYTINNLPSGLTPELTVAANGLSANLVLNGSANDHQNADDVASLNFSFENSAFASNNAPAVFNAINAESNEGIDFNENPTISYGFGELELSGIAEYDGKYGFSNSGFGFSDDGMKLFLVRTFNSRVNQYDLTSPYELTTGVSAGPIGFAYGIQTDDPVGLSFNPSGTKMYIMGDDGTEKEVYQYSLATPFDVTTGVTFDNSLDVLSEGGWLQQMAFSNDGMKLFIATILVADNSTKINQYSLTTPYDVTTGVSFVDSWDDPAIFRPTGIAFNADGSKMLLPTLFGQIHTLALTNPFDITTAPTQEGNTFDMSAIDDRIYDTWISPNAKKVFISGGTSGVHQYSLLENGFQENETNDGSVGGLLVVRATGDTFSNADATLESVTDYSINNLPSGLVPTMTVAADGLSASLTLAGTANDHRVVNDISDLQFSFENSAFVSGNVAAILNSTSANSGYGISFLDGPDVSDQSFSIDENSATGTVVGTVQATSVEGAVTYAIVSGQSSAVFTIDSNSGELTVGPHAQLVNFEAVEVFNLGIEVSDGNLTTLATATINLNDLNEIPGMAHLGEAEESQDEGLAADSPFATISVNDPDEGDTHTFSLVSGEGDGDNSKFSIDGATLTNLDEFDFELKEEYTIRIRATDAGGLFSETDLVISVNDINEAPIIADQTFEASESEGSGFVLGAISASDPEGDLLTFSSLSGEIGSVFDVSSTGSLSLNRAVDFEEEGPYVFIVTVGDDKTPSLESTATITVNVLDANEAPTGIQLSATNLEESNPSGTSVGNLTTIDDDNGQTHIYTLVSGTGDADNASFSISGTELVSAEVFDFETKSTYSVRIQTDDQNGETFEKEFSISIDDLPASVTSLDLSIETINENEAAGFAIGTLSTSGEDLSGSFTYTFVTGSGDNDNGSFTISGDQLTVNAALDFETKNQYNLRIQTDDGGGNTLQETFTISVNDISEAPTALSLSANSLTENNAVNEVIGSLSTTDEDAGETFTHILVAGEGDTDNASFIIVGNELQAGEVFDFESQSSYDIRLQTDDGNGGTFQQAFTITIVDENEAPTVPNVLSDVTVTEGFVSSQRNLATAFVDPDGDALILTASSSDETIATPEVQGTTLVITGSSLGTAVITVSADDGNGGTVSTSFNFTVEVVPQEAPTAIDLSNTASDENQPVNTLVAAITSADINPDDTHSYSLVAGEGDTDNASFSISGSELLAAESFDFETKSSYSIRIQTDDGNGGTFQQAFTITIVNENEAPTVPNMLSDVTVTEGFISSQRSLATAFVDPDGDALTLTASSSDELIATPELQETTLVITGSSLGTAVITVTADDGNGGTVSTTFNFTIEAAAQAPPTAIALSSTSIDENQPINTLVADITSTDINPNDAAVYALISGEGDEDNASFLISESQLFSNEIFDFDTKSSYTIRMQVDDLNGGTFQEAFTISINDLGDNEAPIVAVALTDLSETMGFGMTEVDLSSTFVDADGDMVAINASSSDETIATVAVSGSTLTITEVGIGTSTITVTADDGNGGTVSDEFIVTVSEAPNNAPIVANSLGDEIIVEEGFVARQVSYADVFSDPDGDDLTISVVSNDESVVTVNLIANEQFSVNEVAKGSTTITVTADDGNGGMVSDTFTFTVNEKVNNAPIVANAFADETLEEGFGTRQISYATTFEDADGDDLTISVSSSDEAVVTATVVAGDQIQIDEVGIGTSTITVTADDGNGGMVSDEFIVTVSEVPNNAPIVVDPIDDQIILVEGFDAFQVNYSTTFEDADGDDLTITVASSDETVVTATVIQNNQIQVDEVGIGTSIITVTADDGKGGIVSDEFIVTVSEAPLGLEDQLQVSVFPNPVADFLSIKSSTKIGATLVTTDGRKVMQGSGSELSLDLRSLGSGIYILLINDEGTVTKKQIIKAN